MQIKQLAYIGSGIVLVVIAIVLFIQYRSIRLVESVPTNNASNVSIYQPLSFIFDKTLAPSYMPQGDDAKPAVNTVAIEPFVSGSSTVEGNKIIFSPATHFQPSTEYHITVKGVTSERGGSLGDITITFRTAFVNPSELPTSDPSSPRSKLINSLPHKTSGYEIIHIQDGDYFLIRITKAPVSGQKKAALEYLRNKGLKPEAEDIQYFIIRGL